MNTLTPTSQICITPGAMMDVPYKEIDQALNRHWSGDWGELDEEDKAENDRALKENCRILSAYTASNKVKFWVITEHDRSVTTVLLPEEY